MTWWGQKAWSVLQKPVQPLPHLLSQLAELLTAGRTPATRYDFRSRKVLCNMYLIDITRYDVFSYLADIMSHQQISKCCWWHFFIPLSLLRTGQIKKALNIQWLVYWPYMIGNHTYAHTCVYWGASTTDANNFCNTCSCQPLWQLEAVSFSAQKIPSLSPFPLPLRHGSR